MPIVPAGRQLTIKLPLPDYLIKLSFDSVASADQEYGYPLLRSLSGGILKTFPLGFRLAGLYGYGRIG
jgi:hypothetical protein